MLVLLDHGLYKELPLEFRLDYCRLWKALVLKDLDGVKHYCQKLNAGEMYSLLAAVLTSRSWDDITRYVPLSLPVTRSGSEWGEGCVGCASVHKPSASSPSATTPQHHPTLPLFCLPISNQPPNTTNHPRSPDLGSLKTPSTKEDKTLIRSYAQRYYFEITELLNTVPREMLLLLKMNDCLRHIDRELGAPVNSSLITAEESVKALLRDELQRRPSSLGRRVRAWWDFCKVELRIHTYLYITWAASLVRRGGGKQQQQPQPVLPPPSPVEAEVEELIGGV